MVEVVNNRKSCRFIENYAVIWLKTSKTAKNVDDFVNTGYESFNLANDANEEPGWFQLETETDPSEFKSNQIIIIT